MANMITADQLRWKKREHPNARVVCYVTSTAEVKAESDVCCTSANAVRIVEGLKDAEEIIFVPDQYLGHYVMTRVGREMILWPGFTALLMSGYNLETSSGCEMNTHG